MAFILYLDIVKEGAGMADMRWQRLGDARHPAPIEHLLLGTCALMLGIPNHIRPSHLRQPQHSEQVRQQGNHQLLHTSSMQRSRHCKLISL